MFSMIFIFANSDKSFFLRQDTISFTDKYFNFRIKGALKFYKFSSYFSSSILQVVFLSLFKIKLGKDSANFNVFIECSKITSLNNLVIKNEIMPSSKKDAIIKIFERILLQTKITTVCLRTIVCKL